MRVGFVSWGNVDGRVVGIPERDSEKFVTRPFKCGVVIKFIHENLEGRAEQAGRSNINLKWRPFSLPLQPCPTPRA